MKLLSGSLRVRLLALILIPLLVVSILGIYWRLETARQTAEDIFDRNLIILCLAVSRDIANSGGDSLSQTTANLFRDASGGDVFYHVYGPDGSFVTGYSSPPVRNSNKVLEFNNPFLFDATHRGQPVRAASLAEQVEIDGISGVSVITVWQDLSPRQSFARRLVLQAVALAMLLIATVAGLVIFGIRFGLKPLEQLEVAIKKRSANDLSAIERSVPIEAHGIVSRLNSLFEQLREADRARDRLISNAAHQLKNPIAAIHSMAEATLNAKSLKDSKSRAAELVCQTRATAHLTKQMLSIERIRGIKPDLQQADFSAFVKDYSAYLAPIVLKQEIAFELDLPQEQILIWFDQTLVGEAIMNLVDNALSHGGPPLTFIRLRLKQSADKTTFAVINDGNPIKSDQIKWLFERFAQGRESKGSGLGLAIVAEIAALHHWQIDAIQGQDTRFEITMAKRGADTKT